MKLFCTRVQRVVLLTSTKIRKDKEFSNLSDFGKQIICTFMFRGCEILIEGAVLKANLILLKMWDFDVILGMDWLSTHRALLDYFTKEVMFRKPRFSKLKIEGDRRV